MGANKLGENTPNAHNLSAQTVCPSPKVWDFDEKRLHWVSVVRGTGNTASKLTFSICVVLSWTSFGKHSILISSQLRILFWEIIYNVSWILRLWKAVWSVLQRKIQVCLAQLGDPCSKLSKKRFEYSMYISGQLALNSCCLLCWTGLNWFMDRLGRATCTLHSVSAQTSQEVIEYTIKLKISQGFIYCPNIYTVDLN